MKATELSSTVTNRTIFKSRCGSARGRGVGFAVGEMPPRLAALAQYAFSVRNSANGVCATM